MTMNLFGSTVKGPDVADLKATFENLQAMLSSDEYAYGMDQASTVVMIGGIYKYVIGKLSHGLPLPAPVDYPEDKHKVMWPEGMKVRTRRPSVSSTGSGHYSRRRNQYDLNPNTTSHHAMSRASSATSNSVYSTRYVGIVEEEDDEPLPASRHGQRQPPQKHSSHRREEDIREVPLRPRQEPKRSAGTHRVSGAAMRPTPSIEDFMKGQPDEDDEPKEPPRPPRRLPRTTDKKPKFADDDIE